MEAAVQHLHRRVRLWVAVGLKKLLGQNATAPVSRTEVSKKLLLQAGEEIGTLANQRYRPTAEKFDPHRKLVGRFQLAVFPSQGMADEEDGVSRPGGFVGTGWKGGNLGQTLVKAPLKHLSRLATRAVMRSDVGGIGFQ